MPNEDDDLIATITAAYDAAETGEDASEPEPEVEEPALEDGEPEPESELEEDAPEAEDKPDRVRDEKTGQFKKAPKVPQKAPVPTKGGEKADGRAATEAKGKPAAVVPPAPAAAGAPAPQTVKAPQSWKPAAREAFAKAPPEVQHEVLRREAEITRGLQESAPERQFAQQVRQSLAPYESIARAAGSPDAFTWAGSALQTVAGLYQGPPDHAIALAAQAVQLMQSRFGPQALDRINAILEGKAPGHVPPAPQPQQPVDVEALVARKLEEQERIRDAKAFLADPPEFWPDLQTKVIERIKFDRANGGNMTPRQAYDYELKYSEEHQAILAQRQAAEAARTASATTARARAAAKSVKPSSAARPAPAQPKTVEDEIRRQWDEAEERDRSR